MFLHVKYIRYVAAGGDLSTAPDREIHNEEVALEGEPQIVERMLSSNTNPDERYEIGENVAVRFGLVNPTLTDEVAMHGGSGTETYTKDLSAIPGKLAKYDVRLRAIRASDGVLVPIDITNCNFTGKREDKFKQGDYSVKPVEMKSTASSVITKDNSVS